MEDERLMDEQLCREYEESSESSHHHQTDQLQSLKDVPSTSRDNRYSIPEADLASHVSVRDQSQSFKDVPSTSSDNRYSIPDVASEVSVHY